MCERELEATVNFFFKNNRKEDGLDVSCKECRGRNFTNKVLVKAKEGFKICSKCKEEKPMTEDYYFAREDSKDGFRGDCKECRARYREENKEHIKRAKREYRETNKESILEYECNYRKDNKEKITRYMKDYNKMYYNDNKGKILKVNKEWAERNKDKMKEYRRQYSEKNREQLKEGQKRYYSENRDAIIAKVKQWGEENEEQLREYKRRYYQQNREEILLRVKAYREENEESVKKCKRKHYQNNKLIYKMYAQKRKARLGKLPCTLSPEKWEQIKSDFGNKCAYCGKIEKDHIEEYGQVLHQDHFIPLSKGGAYTHNNIIPACKSCNSSKYNNSFFEWYPTYEHYDSKRETFVLKYLNYTTEKTQQLALM